MIDFERGPDEASSTPTRMNFTCRDRIEKQITAVALVNGLVEAFQPDFMVEMESGSTTGLKFSRGRVITFDQLLSHDEQGSCAYGVDVRRVGFA